MGSPARVFAAGAVLVAVFVAALLVGRSTGGTEGKAATAAEIKVVKLPAASMKVPPLAPTGTVPKLHPKPASTSSTGSTAPTAGSGTSSGSGTTATSRTTTSGSTGTTSPSGGGGSTPPPPVPR